MRTNTPPEKMHDNFEKQTQCHVIGIGLMDIEPKYSPTYVYDDSIVVKVEMEDIDDLEDINSDNSTSTHADKVEQNMIECIDPVSIINADSSSTGKEIKSRRQRDPFARVKLYNRAPYDNPVEERKRQNAINAKKNRDKQTEWIDKITGENVQLKLDQESLKSENELLKLRLSCQQKDNTILKLKFEMELLKKQCSCKEESKTISTLIEEVNATETDYS